MRNRFEHTPEQLAAHFEAIGDAPNGANVSDEVRLPPQRPVDEVFALPPEDGEIATSMAKMRESAAGPDEVTINLIRMSAPEVRHEFSRLLQWLWAHPGVWEDGVPEAEVVVFCKKGDRNVLDHL